MTIAKPAAIVVSGRVQGVGFRWFVEREAAKLGITGWVRNRDNGSVEVMATGTREQLSALHGRLREGPRAARVDDVCSVARAVSGSEIISASKEPGNPCPSATENCNDLKKLIREVPDFPKPGILFYDITTLLKDRQGFARLIDSLTEYYINKDIDLVLGIEARGFIFGPALAYRLNAGFVPVRKPKKLPAEVLKWTYDLEYGSGHPGNPQGRHHGRAARAHLRRSAGHRRHRPRRGGDGEVAGRAISAAWDSWWNSTA